MNRIYNLEEFTEQNQIDGLFGSALVCFTADRDFLRRVVHPGIGSFYSVNLIVDGWEDYIINRNQIYLEMHDLFVKQPYDNISVKSFSEEVSSIHLLVERNYFDSLVGNHEHFKGQNPVEVFSSMPVIHLSELEAASFYQMMTNIQRTISTPHLYKNELIKYQLNICLFMLAELISGTEINTHDLKHKDNILKIFLHLASRNFRKERQIQFYADHLNVSSTYLSRTVKELTGNTVLSYLSNFLYNEICIQLKTTDKTISEIADELNFSDQSALTNFFRTKAGVSPVAYRSKKVSR
jgi:AraC-like DNA-binding protein